MTATAAPRAGVARTAPLDYPTRHSATTDRYCVVCHKDIKTGKDRARFVHVIEGGSHVLHPDDEDLYVPDRGDMGLFEIGPECARRLGVEFTSRPPQHVVDELLGRTKR